jgi:sugar/nucleoside kinase (ribokinase family)
MQKQIDVLGLGCCAVDDILYVDQYPPADAKIHVRRRERHCGGLTATALVASSRLGARAAFGGTLGFDEGSEFVLETFAREGVDTSHVVRTKGAGPVRSVIVVDERRGTRNIFAFIDEARGADPRRPARAVIESARVLLIDYFGTAGNIRAARMARGAGIPVVADLERTTLPRTKELLRLVDHPVFSLRAARELSGESRPGRAAARLFHETCETVVVTCGEQGAWFASREHRAPQHCPAFKVRAIDTTGCGDVFHGAYAAALARGMGTPERIRFAAAAAALKATRHGGQAGIPSLREVMRLLGA